MLGSPAAVFAGLRVHARFLFLRRDEPNPHEVPRDTCSCCVTAVVWLPGTWKDILLLKHAPNFLSSRSRVAKGARPRIDGETNCRRKRRLRTLSRVCASKARIRVNATNLTRRTWDLRIKLFADCRARFNAVYLEPSVRQILERHERREALVPEFGILKTCDKV